MSDLKLLETERLVLSGWSMDQVDDLVRLHGTHNVARYLNAEGLPWTRAQAETAVAHWIELFETCRLGKMRLTRKSDGAFIGRAGYGVYPPTDEPEIGFALFEQHHGQGYATEAATALRDWIFRETNSTHFIGMADVRNIASLTVLGKIGLVKTHVEAQPGGSGIQFHILRRPALHD